MSTSSKAAEPRAGRRGFTLVEALVALVVAGLILPSLARALGGAWAAVRTPLEIVSAMTLARDVAAGGSVPAEARRLGYTAERTSAVATVLVLPSDVAPAPRGTGKDERVDDYKPESTPAGIKLAAPLGLGGPAPGDAPANVVLRRIAVVVGTPSGRRIALDGLKVDDAPR